ncbi:TonB family protein [Acidithiobacillus sp. M4-SHS-6]|uniref:energy transducer TonB n=1 Tax=Acidithiobacillus sp. M4-SHS-6 TaxID=3383024 RepID=UPI0039BE6BDD
MSGLALPAGPQPPRAVVFLLALILELGILAVLAAWLRISPAPRPALTPPMMVQLAAWPQPGAAPQPAPRKPAARTAAPTPRKSVPVPRKVAPKSLERRVKVPIRSLPAAPSALAVPAASSTRSRTAAPAASAADTAALPPAPPAPPAESRPSIPAYAHNPAPDYPQSARWEGEEGTVVLRVLVNSSGLPEKITVARSSGYTSLDRAAEKAVQRWRFTPGTRDGKAVAMQVEIPIRFRLRDAEP